MGAELFFRPILVAIIQHRAIITAEDDQGISGEIETLECLDQFADTPVQLDNRIAPEAELEGWLPARVLTEATDSVPFAKA